MKKQIERSEVIALAKEFNNIHDLKISVKKSDDTKDIEKAIKKAVKLLQPEDFTNEDGEAFTTEATATLKQLFPAEMEKLLKPEKAEKKLPPVKANKGEDGKKKKAAKKDRYTRSNAFVDALKKCTKKGKTKEEIVQLSHELYVKHNPDSAEESSSKHHKFFVAEVMFRYTMPALLLLEKVELKDSKYTLIDVE